MAYLISLFAAASAAAARRIPVPVLVRDGRPTPMGHHHPHPPPPPPSQHHHSGGVLSGSGGGVAGLSQSAAPGVAYGAGAGYSNGLAGARDEHAEEVH